MGEIRAIRRHDKGTDQTPCHDERQGNDRIQFHIETEDSAGSFRIAFRHWIRKYGQGRLGKNTWQDNSAPNHWLAAL